MGGSGVQRPLKFVKYLREFGWNPIILRPEPGLYSIFDESLQQELDDISPEQYMVKGNTPFHLFGGKGRTAKALPGFASNLVRQGLKLVMYPDNKKGWIEPGFEKGLEIIQEENIDLIFSTAPPFSNHILGKKLKEETGRPLILDYRDSWTDNQFFTNLFGWQKKIMKKQERSCAEAADVIVGLDEVTLDGISENYRINPEKLKIVEHGFDPEDFRLNIPPTLKYKERAMNLLYSGTFVEQNQPDTFLGGVGKCVREGRFKKDDLHLHFQGGLNSDIRKTIERLGLKEMVTEYGYMDHKQAVANLKAADALWMLENYDASLKQIKNGKLFEYFGSGKPILGVVNPGVSAGLLEQYGPGFVADVNNGSDIADKLQEMFSNWKESKFSPPNNDFVSLFNRNKLTQKLALIFDKISSQ